MAKSKTAEKLQKEQVIPGSDAMKEGIKFGKAKIKNELFLYVEYTEELPGHSKNGLKNDCTVPIHDDLKAAMQKLHRHLALLCDEIEIPSPKKKFLTTEFAGFYVTGFTASGNDDNAGVVISGYKDGKYGSVNLNTPFTKFVGGDYPFHSELGQDIISLEYEIDQYLFKGKRAPEVQLEMEMPEAPEPGAEEED